MNANAAGYMATKQSLYLYPRAGDAKPPGGAKVLLLTNGGICVVGQWKDEPWCVGWHPLPGRDYAKEGL
jgi:hypothetical protein